jgi:hypothetical protein
LEVPFVDKVPVIAPVVGMRVKPAGSAPADIDQVRGNVPPEAAAVWEYTAPAVPPGSPSVVIVSVAATAIERGLNAVAPAASTALIVKVYGPGAAVGVPEMMPVTEFKVSPAGSAPADIDQLSGRVPPVVAIV